MIDDLVIQTQSRGILFLKFWMVYCSSPFVNYQAETIIKDGSELEAYIVIFFRYQNRTKKSIEMII